VWNLGIQTGNTGAAPGGTSGRLSLDLAASAAAIGQWRMAIITLPARSAVKTGVIVERMFHVKYWLVN
jgi:hypothetical protein